VQHITQLLLRNKVTKQ